MPEVEVDVLAIVLSADAFFEEDPVCGDFEEIGVVGEVFGSILFGTELEWTPFDLRCSICWLVVSRALRCLMPSVSAIPFPLASMFGRLYRLRSRRSCAHPCSVVLPASHLHQQT